MQSDSDAGVFVLTQADPLRLKSPTSVVLTVHFGLPPYHLETGQEGYLQGMTLPFETHDSSYAGGEPLLVNLMALSFALCSSSVFHTSSHGAILWLLCRHFCGKHLASCQW